MTAQIIDCEQGTEQWFRARMGIPTASEFATVVVGGTGSRTYMRKLAGEVVTGELMEAYSNSYMERGKAMEAEARNVYSLTEGVIPQQIGFVRNVAGSGYTGCSPDSFIGNAGMLEIKTAAPHMLIDLIERDVFPNAHVAQCQGGLWVCEREWIDLLVYWPKMPFFLKRVIRDEPYIERLAKAVRVFNEELAALVERVRKYGVRELAA